jgi:transposase
MIGDRAYDSDPLDQRLRQKHRIRLIAPHKYNRYRKNTQDGRELRRYCRRWKIERLFAWLHNFRRLVSPGNTTRPTSSPCSSSAASSSS